MSKRDEYKIAHKLAKFIVCMTVIILMILHSHYGSPYLDVAAVVVWFFGTNPVAYIIEHVMDFNHKHDLF